MENHDWAETFCKSTAVFFIEALYAGKADPHPDVDATEDRTLPLPWWRWSIIMNLPFSSWMITLGNGAISGTQCWFSAASNGTQQCLYPLGLGETPGLVSSSLSSAAIEDQDFFQGRPRNFQVINMVLELGI